MSTAQRDVPFTQIPDWIILHPDLTHATVRVYLAICHRVDKHRTSWPSINRIARDAHCSPTTVKEALKQLEGIGALIVTRAIGVAGEHHTNHYHLPMGVGQPVTQGGPVSDSGGGPVSDPELHPATTTPIEQQIAKRDEWWDTLTELLGKPTPNQTKLQGRLVARVKADGLPPEEILVRAERLASAWGPEKLTLASLEKHWERWGVPLAGITKQQLAANARQREMVEAMRSLE